MAALSAVTFALSWWLGLYLVARDPRKPVLALAALGLCGYAVVMALDTVRLAAPVHAEMLGRIEIYLVAVPGVAWLAVLLELARPDRWRPAGKAAVVRVEPTLVVHDATAAIDYEPYTAAVGFGTVRRYTPAEFTAATDQAAYRGRPDGAAVDSEGAYWVAMFEGQRLLRLAPDGQLLADVPLPVRCPTMPCFGGDDLRTLFVTTSREKRPADELAAQPWAGCVLMARVDVPGLPVHFAAPGS